MKERFPQLLLNHQSYMWGNLSNAAAAMPAGMSAGIAVAPAGATAAACAH